MEDKLQEATQQLADEEEKAKGLAKQKTKQDAVIADLEERLRNSERVRIELDLYVTFPIILTGSFAKCS